jgi:hypothetical protein
MAGAVAGVAVGTLAWMALRRVTDVGPVERLEVGDRFPTMRGRTLAGDPLTIPDDLLGSVSVLIMANRYSARDEVEAWATHLATAFGDRPDLRYLQVPMIGGVGPVMQRMIDRAMVRGTPQAAHAHVVTVYDDMRVRFKQLGITDLPQAYLFVLDTNGRIAWHAEGALTPSGETGLGDVLRGLGIGGEGGAQTM